MHHVVVCFDGLEVISTHGPFASYFEALEEAERLQRGLDYSVEVVPLEGEVPGGWSIAAEEMTG